jgi:hypothetical protein
MQKPLYEKRAYLGSYNEILGAEPAEKTLEKVSFCKVSA